MNDSVYTTPGNEFTAPKNIPGIYTYEVTQTVKGCESPGATVTLTIKERPLPPVGSDVTVCEGEPVPALVASGDHVSWYSDSALSNLVHLGNEYQTGQIHSGTYSYYVTARMGDCESMPDTIVLSILAKPDPPMDTMYTACGSGAIPDLIIEGENLNWYTDEALLELVHSGKLFATGKTEAGTYTWYVTETIQECVSSPSSVGLVIGELPLPPLTQDIEICVGDSLPELVAAGDSIRWYSDEQLANLVHTGTSMLPEFNAPGSFSYYVTQSLDHCESSHATASLTIKPRPGAPLSEGLSACEGEDIPALVARGDSIRWYDTPDLENMIHLGTDFVSEEHAPGSYSYYATQTQEGCEGMASEVELLVNESPIISLGNDTSIRDDGTIILGPYPIEFTYLWSNISSEPYLKIDGGEIGPGNYQISVQVSNDLCIYRDTMILTVESTIGIDPLDKNGSIKVYPNPTEDFITVEFGGEPSDNSLINIIDSKGALVRKIRLKEVLSKGDRSLIIALGSPGVYIVQIYNGNQVSSFKVIRY